MSNKYLILNKGETPFSQVVNDCETGFCFPVGKGENLSTVIKKMCSYLSKIKTEETDPYFRNSVAHDITAADITNWDLAYSWGDHAGLYAPISHTHSLLDLTQSNATTGQVPVWNGTEWEPQTIGGGGGGGPESDPVFTAWLSGIPNLSEFNNDVGYLTSYTEIDPIFTASDAFGITSTDISNWNNAFSWGDHSLAGYLTSESDPVFSAWLASPPNISTFTNDVGYITLGSLSGGTGISYNNATGVITNTAPDQTVSLSNGTGISVSGTYPNFTITNTAPSSLSGSGTTNYVPKWSSSTALTDSSIFDNGTSVGIGTATPNAINKLQVAGIISSTSGFNADINAGVKTGLYSGGNSFTFWAGNNQLSTYTLVGNTAGASYFSHTIPFNNSGGASGTQSAWRIASSVADTGVNSMIHNQLLIDPQYVHGVLGTGALRGVYYNPTLTSLNGAPHIAWENTSGDIIHGNLGGGGTQMVVADNTGKLGVQTIPVGGGGTVTSVSASTGMSFTTITGSGSVAIDTTKVPYYSGGFSTGFAKWNGAAWVFDNSTYLTTISGLNISLLTNDSGYITSSALSPYLTSVTAASTYFPLTGGSLTGTAGAGFFGAIAQSSNPSAPTSGFRLFANNSHAFSWIGQNGYIRTFDGTANTADRTYTLPNVSGTFPLGTGTTNELAYWSGTNTLSTLTTATYPSLTELSYVKGVTSAIQTQFDSGRENHLIRAYAAMGSTVKAQSLGMGMHNIGSAATIGATNNSRLTLIAIYLETPQTITGVKWYQGTLGSYTANNENRVGLYTVSGGTLTLVASCANDGNLWQTVASNTFGAKAFSSTYAASPGLYYIGLLYSNSAVTTAPTIGISSNVVNSNVQSGDFSNGLGLQLVKTTVVALPSSITASTYTQVQQQYWAAIY